MPCRRRERFLENAQNRKYILQYYTRKYMRAKDNIQPQNIITGCNEITEKRNYYYPPNLPLSNILSFNQNFKTFIELGTRTKTFKIDFFINQIFFTYMYVINTL